MKTLIPYGDSVPDYSGNSVLLASPSVKTYLNSASPESVTFDPEITPVLSTVTQPKISTVDGSGNIIALASDSTGALVPTIVQTGNASTPLQALNNLATSLGLGQSGSINSDNIIIYIAGGIALLGILALIFKN